MAIDYAMTVGGLFMLLHNVLKDHPEVASKAVFVPIDEEGNDFYPLNPAMTIDPKAVRACFEVSASGCPEGADPSDCVILG